MTIQDLESHFNLVCRLRDSILMMARANRVTDSPELRKINVAYNMLHSEIMLRIDSLYVGETERKEALNE